MRLSKRVVLSLVVTAGLLAPPSSAVATPPGWVQKCSEPAFRQAHLSECNLQGGRGFGFGSGGSGGGLLGIIGDIVGGLTGGVL